MFLTDVSESAQQLKNYVQIILTLAKVDVLLVESKANFYQ